MIQAPSRLQLRDLTDDVRDRMLREWEAEDRGPAPYRSDRLTREGIEAFRAAVPVAFRLGSELTLADALLQRHYWHSVEHRTSRYGNWVVARTPRNAHIVLATSEFLTFYTRGVAGLLLEQGEALCLIYRAAPALQPRCLCRRRENQQVETRAVYDGHRAQYWPQHRPRAFSIPVGPNCHHTVTRVPETTS